MRNRSGIPTNRKLIPACVVLSFAFVTVSAAEATATVCTRWRNLLNECDVLDSATCNTPSPTQILYYRRRVFRDNAQDACFVYWREFRRKYPMTPWDGQAQGTKTCGVAVAIRGNAEQSNCYPDFNCDKVANGNDTTSGHHVTVLRDTMIPRDECCDRIPNGPFAWMQDAYPELFFGTGTQGATFSYETKNIALNQNIADTLANHGVNALRSNSYDILVPPPYGRADTIQYLTPPTAQEAAYNLWDWYTDPDYKGSWWPTQNQARATVDHIIPRVDSHGCACGPDTIANAQVISASSNSSMQNSCEDPRRKEILKVHSLAP